MSDFKHTEIYISLLFTAIVGAVGWNTGLFWDNILFVNKMSIPLIENGVFAWGSIPLQYDPGHPPFIATYMSLMWSLLGRSLHVTHCVLYPFLLLFFWELLHIAKLICKNHTTAIILVSLVLCDPTIFASLMYIGTEVFIFSFSVVAIRGIITNHFWRKTLGLMLLAITSLRGMMLCAGLFLWDVAMMVMIKRVSLRKLCSWDFLCAYVMASIPAMIFIIWRLIFKGWITDNPIAPWGDATGFNDLSDFLFNFFRNVIVFLQRITDFGRIVLWIIVGVLLWKGRDKIRSNSNILAMLLFIGCSCVLIIVTSLVIRNPMGHNYFSLVYMGLAFILIELTQNINWRKSVIALSMSALFLGNFIVYPDSIAQGWAASLASLPYWDLRKELFAYIDEKQISRSSILFKFPFGTCADDVELNNDERTYAVDIQQADYFVVSNICNPSDEDLQRTKKYTPIFHSQKRGVYVTLYKVR